MTGEQNRFTTRNDKIQTLYLTGEHSLRDLGRQFGINHERVRQILNARQVPLNPPYKSLPRKSRR